VCNLRLVLQYDGSDFSGYELQPGKRTIRGELEKALKKIYGCTIKISSSSRTDAGVHALGQVISFKPPFEIPLKRLPAALNSVLPEDIRVLKAEKAEKREKRKKREKGGKGEKVFDARAKTYEYLIFNGEVMPPHLRRFAWHVRPKLDLSAMRRAAKILVGKHDFSSFCAAGGDDKNFVRTIYKIIIRKKTIRIWGLEKVPVISLVFVGNGFLYKMVRNMVGTLLEVGLGKKRVSDVKKILQAKDRRLAGRTAPAQGLCLIRVKY
jgi:tRNA pseudouridine38-40 synthase